MGVYRKNVGLLKATYKSNVKVGSIIIESPGKFLANSYGLDAASLINVRLGELPDAITDFIGGNNLVTVMNVPPSVSDVKGVFAPVFPNLEKVYLGNAENDSTLKDGLDTAYANLTVDVYCEDALVSGYQTKYASATNLTFIGVSNLIGYEIPFVGETTLTAEYVEQVANDLGTLVSAMEKIVVPSGFTEYEAGALDEIFEQFANLQELESPWLNGDINNLELTIPYKNGVTSKTLTSSIVNDAENIIGITLPNIKVTKLNIPSYFDATSQDGTWLGVFNGASLDKLTSHAGITYLKGNENVYNIKDLSIDVANVLAGSTLDGTSSVSNKLEIGVLNCSSLRNNRTIFAFRKEIYITTSNVTWAIFDIFRTAVKIDLGDCTNAALGYQGTLLFRDYNGSYLRMANIGSSFSGLELDYASNLDHDSLAYILANAQNLQGGSATLKLGATNIAKLTQSEIDAFTAKGWTLQ